MTTSISLFCVKLHLSKTKPFEEHKSLFSQEKKKINFTNASGVIVESRSARTKRGIGRNQAAVTSLIRPLEVADHNSKTYCRFSAFQSKHPM